MSMAQKVNQENYPLNIRFNLRNTNPSNVETPINAIVRFNNQRIVLSKISKVEPRYWNVYKGEPKQHAGNINHKTISKALTDAKACIKEVFNDYTNKHNSFPSDLKTFQEALRKTVFNIPDKVEVKKDYDNLSDYMTRFISKCEQGLRTNPEGKPLSENTIKTYRTTLRNINMFKATGHDVSFNRINLEFYEDYKEFLMLELKYGANTIGKHLRTLKAVVNEAREDGFTEAVFVGKRYKIKSEKVTKVYLDKDELQVLFDLDLSDQPTTLGVARDLFLLGANSALRFGDWLKLDPKRMKDDIIEVKTQKTGVVVAVPINQMIKDILKKYEDNPNGLPPKMTNQELNRYIKTVCERAKFTENITVERTKAGQRVLTNVPKYKMVKSHTARRSAATNMYNLGIPTPSIMKITGHTTEANFLSYIVLTDKEHAKKVLEITRRNDLKLINGGLK